MKKIIWLAIAIPGLAFAMPVWAKAQETGIKFENDKSWQKIKDEARAEHKYIFVDCYATWCGPCKEMDHDVYSSPAVGDSVNRHFISVKVQFDTSHNDSEFIKQWYADASRLVKENHIDGFPTF